MAAELSRASTEVLVLSLLAEEPMYGYQIAKELHRRSGGYFDFKEGTLYPLLHRLEKQGLVRGQWQVVERGPSRKYYHLTESGKKALERSAEEWATFSHRLLKILGKAEANPLSM